MSEEFDFSKYQKILELGCGEMIDGLFITTLNPNIQYLATDYDKYLIQRCSNLSILKIIEKKAFDLSHDNIDVITNECKLIYANNVFQCLEDESMNKLFKIVAEKRISLLIIDRTITRIFGYIIDIIKYNKYFKKYRSAGWRRSIGYYRKMIKPYNLCLKIIGTYPGDKKSVALLISNKKLT